MTMDDGSDETVQVDFTLAAGALGMNASVRVPLGEVTLTQLLPVLQELTNDIVGGVVEVVKTQGLDVSCRAGCGACCRQMVPLSLFEAEALGEWMSTLPPERQEALQERFRVALEQLEERGILAKMGPQLWRTGEDEGEAFGLEYMKARVACPFLENESCGIHPIRPLICREYLVTSPPEYCGIPVPEKVDRIAMPVKVSNGLFHLGAKIERHARGWIPLVFLIQWMKNSERPGKAVSGAGPDVLFALLRELSPNKNEVDGDDQPAG
jgi:Fe-S-cluster containining protein